ncbi:MAG: hypothetical protein NXI01_05500 [Gammaproteobacteria bacterium]|nr:hypothetical protein [Gammaproteobacteria bacterium]
MPHAKTLDDLYASLGRGDLKLAQIINRLTPSGKVEPEQPMVTKIFKPATARKSRLHIEGVENLLSHMARCCQPVAGDKVVGYITLGRGVSIHRQDCTNILRATPKQQDRFLEVNWGEGYHNVYVVDVLIKAFSRHALLKDVTALLSIEKAHVLSLKTDTDQVDSHSLIYLTIEIDSLSSLSRLLNRLEHIPNIIEARRLV